MAELAQATATTLTTQTDYGINGPRSVNYDAGADIGFQFTGHTFSLTRLARQYDELDDLRNFNQSAGDFLRTVHADGGWTVVDDSGGNNCFTITPPTALKPMLVEADWFLASYSESQRSTSGVAEVDLQFERATPREPEDIIQVLSQSQGTNDWLFDFLHGKIAVPTGLMHGQVESEGRRIELTMTLTQAQAEVILEIPNRYEATSVEEIPDERDFARDNHPDNRNTVTVSQPSDLASEWFRGDGEYIIRDWRLETTSVPFKYEWKVTLRVPFP